MQGSWLRPLCTCCKQGLQVIQGKSLSHFLVSITSCLYLFSSSFNRQSLLGCQWLHCCAHIFVSDAFGQDFSWKHPASLSPQSCPSRVLSLEMTTPACVCHFVTHLHLLPSNNKSTADEELLLMRTGTRDTRGKFGAGKFKNHSDFHLYWEPCANWEPLLWFWTFCPSERGKKLPGKAVSPLTLHLPYPFLKNGPHGSGAQMNYL